MIFVDLDVHIELIRVALAYALTRNEIKFVQSLMTNVRRIRPYFDLAKVFARLSMKENQNQIHSDLARELWDRIFDIFQGHLAVKQSRNRHHPLPEKLSVIDLEQFLININQPQILQILFSLLTRLYSLVLIDQSHVEIFSEYARAWPTSLDYRQRSSIRSSSLAQFIQHLFEHIQTLKYLPLPIKSSLVRTQADIHLTLQQYTQAMRAYINSIAIETALFSTTSITQQDDSIIRNMIKAGLQLGKCHFQYEDLLMRM